MKRTLFAVAILLISASAEAQQWAIGVSGGPFGYGDFASSSKTITNEVQTVRVTTSLTAPVRAGVTLDLERFLTSRWSVRAESSYTHTELAVKSRISGATSSAIPLDVASLDVATAALPLVYRINSGRLQLQVFAGPAYAFYDMNSEQSSGDVPLFSGTRSGIGAEAGGGLEWIWKKNLVFRALASDIVTRSPLRRSDFEGPAPGSLKIEAPNNLHLTFGLSYRY